MKDLIYHKLLEPRSIEPDDRRRELILNILLVGLFTTGMVGLIIVIIDLLTSQVVYGRTSLIEETLFVTIIASFWLISRAGWYKLISYILLFLIGGLAIALVLQWSFELPMAELSYGLMVVVAGVLLSARSALLFSSLAISCLALISWQQTNGRLHPRTDWLDQPPVLSDALGYATIFGAIGLVSWLANREIDRSLNRARVSEAALAVERDSLEVKVKQRTRQLETAQLTRTMELQHLAEFGRINAHWLHEISSPVTAASINLEQLQDRKSQAITNAQRNLRQLQTYIRAARQQLQKQSNLTNFSVNRQLKQIQSLTTPIARRNKVDLLFVLSGTPKLYGDAVRFSQIVSNLILNAIEAYPATMPKHNLRQVVLKTEQKANYLEITVEDHGAGIKPGQLSQIFEPFYTTKHVHKRGIGIGLAMVKQYVEIDFNGTIEVKSSPETGTKFTIRLRS